MAYYESGSLRLKQVDKGSLEGLCSALDRAITLFTMAKSGSDYERSALVIARRIERDIRRELRIASHDIRLYRRNLSTRERRSRT
jgi:hypothetical protein